ncbi:flagellar protein FlaG [Balnearium lithotrophicum]|uniref:Flagellar protein FlaG n=1 Tax=Balnearium lithotrophicum TaxID=223788 RepID=A0A521DBX3_9BACT|nr:flagellar protein FlaG [Balnearium lithotrophicum]SMO69088.1 flagellar protein FlaG [Balnearium lithotrophicum]
MDVKSIQNIDSARQINSQNLQALDQKNQVRIQKETIKQQEEKIEKLKNEKVSPEVVEKVLEELRKKLSMLNTQLQIKIDKDTDITVVKVVDKQTNKVIRQIPPEYVLKIAKYLDEITGLLLREKA